MYEYQIKGETIWRFFDKNVQILLGGMLKVSRKKSFFLLSNSFSASQLITLSQG